MSDNEDEPNPCPHVVKVPDEIKADVLTYLRQFSNPTADEDWVYVNESAGIADGNTFMLQVIRAEVAAALGGEKPVVRRGDVAVILRWELGQAFDELRQWNNFKDLLWADDKARAEVERVLREHEQKQARPRRKGKKNR